MIVATTPTEIVTFWREAGPDRWFADDHAFDLAVRSRFFATYEAAARPTQSAIPIRVHALWRLNGYGAAKRFMSNA